MLRLATSSYSLHHNNDDYPGANNEPNFAPSAVHVMAPHEGEHVRTTEKQLS